MTGKPHDLPGRAEPRDIAELRQLGMTQPELATAVDLQIALLELQRRIQVRVPLPWLDVNAHWLEGQQRAGRPLLRFQDIPIDWTDLRLMVRETADLLRRFDEIEDEEFRRIQLMVREGRQLEALVRAWFESSRATHGSHGGGASDAAPAALTGHLEQVVQLAMRPFLARCAEAVLPRLDLTSWTRGCCPLCGGEPDFAVITPAAERQLCCSRCTGRWPFDAFACPFCANAERSRIASFTSRDGRYRIYACQECRRYVKAYDARGSSRPVMVPVDSVATLPLDAAAIQKGYRS